MVHENHRHLGEVVVLFPTMRVGVIGVG